MTKKKKKACAATIILAIIGTGTKVESPYDVKNFFEDHMTSELLCQFFYGKDGEKLKLVDEICKVRAEEFKDNQEQKEKELKEPS